jgi:hypothetical protein
MHAVGEVESQGNSNDKEYKYQMQVYHTNIKERFIRVLII